MRKYALLMLVAVILFVVPSLILDAVYGPSYGFLSGEDCWVADGSGGRVKHGNPDDPPPQPASVNVSCFERSIPVALPILYLIVFFLIRGIRGEPARSA
jgi:hypothetical protein